MLTGPLHTVAIPDTLQDALMARLDQLNRAKEVAQLGAVRGSFYELFQPLPHRTRRPYKAGAVGSRRTPLSTGAAAGQVYL